MTPLAAATGPTGHLLSDAAVGAAILIAALIPISVYVTVARRRDQRAAQEAARQEARRQWAALAGSPGQELLRYFGPRHARQTRPDGSRAPVQAAGAGGPWPQRAIPAPGRTWPTADAFLPTASATRDPVGGRRRAAESMAAAPVYRANRNPASHRAHSGQRGHQPDPVPAASPDTDPGSMVRHTPVSGRPPWEPARPPSAINPWAADPLTALPALPAADAASPPPTP